MSTETYCRYRIPSPVFACNTITKLEIFSCKLVVPSKLTGLWSVKSPVLSSVTVADDHLRMMISRCKAMEKLVISSCLKVKNIVICALSLSDLVINLCHPVGILLKSTPRLASVSVSLSYDFDFYKSFYASFEEEGTDDKDSIGGFGLSDFEKTFEGTNELQILWPF